MDHFVVSARKYRPATFNTVVGQVSITTTLKNAIKSKHLAQAFLFCGPRGVGKTTCARILAKTINCTNLSEDTEGCNSCESCVSFNNGQSLNIFELDAASNNSVDDMRNLVEQVRYPPQTGNYKIYIIDEVHMLSTQAFNAFLKTLEEPPPYAIFILATTEKHKIIPTILSRCQIFDFNRITIDDIEKHLQWIASSEGVSAEPEALHLIAQKADGALRDALSIFDQIVSFAGNTVTYKHVIENLNILDYEYYFKITDHLVIGDFPSALLLLNEIINDGFDVHHFIGGLNSHFRDLLICKDPQTIQLLEVGSKAKEKYKAQSQQCSAELLFRLLEVGNKCDIEFKSAQNQRLLTELTLLKMCSFHKDAFAGHSSSAATLPKAEKKTPDVTRDGTVAAAAENAFTAAATQNAAAADEAKAAAATDEAKAAAANPVPTSAAAAATPSVAAKPATRGRSTTGGTVSISDKLKPVKNNEDDKKLISTEEKLIDNSFSEDEMIAALRSFAEKILGEGRRQFAAALNKHQAVLIDNKIIEIPVDNTIQSTDILDNRTELLGWMKEHLANNTIEIRPRVVEEHHLKDTAYTPAEKFSKMVEKNPDLNQLRSQFDLELDF